MEHELLKKVKIAVQQIEPNADIFLYGSRARKDYRETSDWDFLVLVDGPVNSHRTDRIRAVLYDLELDSGEIISSIVRNREEWDGPKFKFAPLHENIEREGVRL
jgi:predicted nucleotidyltransferase